MTYVIAQACIGQKDASCVEACPVDSIEVCPHDAVFAEDQLPPELSAFAQLNAEYHAA